MMRLSLSLGVTLEALARTMSASELALWISYYELEPFGPVRDDLRAGVVASIAAASNGMRVRPEEIFPSLRDDRPRERLKRVPLAPPRSMCVWLGVETN
ncbi:phage tail assembly protein T [Gemmata sp.]|uniref:phage tail assembly protein T n=1 Tax=Gemmata sp. TaxID=1914242 RepID=UPI003F72D0FB